MGEVDGLHCSSAAFCVDVLQPGRLGAFVLGDGERADSCRKLCCTGARKQLEVCVALQVFNLTNPAAPYKELESPLKFQTRCITCFPDSTGYLVSMIMRCWPPCHCSEGLHITCVGRSNLLRCCGCSCVLSLRARCRGSFPGNGLYTGRVGYSAAG